MNIATQSSRKYNSVLFSCILSIFIGVGLTTGLALAEPVKVSASTQSDFVRIVFNWDSPVTHSLSRGDGQLRLRFGRPIEASYAGIARKLKKFVKVLSPGNDGQSVNIGLAGDFDVYSFDSGRAIILEIVKKKEVVDKPSVLSGANRTNLDDDIDNLPMVRVRAAQHTNYTRLVFDWPNKVSYRFKKNSGIATLVFERAARFNLKALQLRSLSFIDSARAEVSDESSSVILSVPAASKVLHFLSGTKVVLDIRRPNDNEKANSLVNSSNLTKIKKTKVSLNTSPATTRPTRLMPVKSPPTVVIKNKVPPIKAVVEKNTVSSVPSSGVEKPRLAPKLSSKSVVTASAKSSGPPADAVTLRFDWNEPVGAAIFRRAGNLWVAFDKLKTIDIGKLRKVGKKFIKGIEQMGTSKATVLRLSMKKGINPSVRRDGMAWLLDFSRQQVTPQVPLIVKAQPNSPVGARLFIPVTEPKNPIGITDPVIGDNIIILPVIPLGHGIGLEYIYPQVGFLPTIQGIVVKPRADDIRTRPLKEGVEVTSAGGLKISAVSAEDEENRSKGPLSRVLDLEPWIVDDIESFRPRKHELLYAVSRSKGPQRELARLNLARFYFANGYNTEALAVLREVSRSRAGVEKNPEYRMLRGGANFMLGRYFEADKDFAHEKLKLIDEAAFWRASIRASIGNVSESALVLKRTNGIIKPYPKVIKVPMGQLVVSSALAIGNTKLAKKSLDSLRKNDLSPKLASQLDFQEGKIMEQSAESATDPSIADSQFEAVAAKWDAVSKSEHQPSRQMATVALVELLLKKNKISRVEAIKNLENIRFSWRGDNFEFNLLRRLGTLYLEEGRYRKGLNKLRQATTYYRTNKESSKVTQQMSEVFSELYLDDAADILPPVTAIALYDEFKELTPSGTRGDKMIQKLADRLVGVDLLDRAAVLLKSQVQFRLQGDEKARVGAQLSLVHILARQFAEALKVLSATETVGIPDTLLSQRRHLRAKALMAMKQREAALDVLNDDKSRDAELLRAELFWNARNWSKASQSLHLLLRESGAKKSGSLDAIQKAYVLNFVIALTLSGNERGLRRARKDFSSKMAKSRLMDAFNLITATTSMGVLDYKLVKSRVMEAEKFQTFLAGYRERLKNENLSDLVPRA